MTAKRAPGTKRWTVELAVFLFVLQGLLLAFGMGAQAAPVGVDRFGNVLCHSESHDRAPAGNHGAPKLDCCKLGCPAGPDRAAAPPPEGLRLPVERLAEERLAYALVRSDGVGLDRKGARARAPPSAL